ncbi:MAG: C_GCAxxG_C_C family protein [Clostridia bacterium]|nr:C_GCAxxG_C_C family protein [Clostridia bacterium]
MTYKERAVELFMSGANCAQAVFATFAPLCGIDEDMALRIAASFGGGLGGQHEVCGAVSGMCMAAGALYGYTDLSDAALKRGHYALIRALCDGFRAQFDTIICRELLDAKRASYAPDPSPRTEEYYRQRPCARLVGAAAELLAAYIEAHPIA